MLKRMFEVAPSRRGFLLGAGAFAGGLMIGFRPGAAKAQAGAASPFQGYVAIAPDDTVTIFSAHMDMGQGIYHGIATLVNEELGADWAKIRVEGGWGNPKLYGNLAMGGAFQLTGGSSGTPFRRQSWNGQVCRWNTWSWVSTLRISQHSRSPSRARIGSMWPCPSAVRNAIAIRKLRRIATAEDIANAVFWLVSDAARYVTGVALPVDAGFVNKR